MMPLMDKSRIIKSYIKGHSNREIAGMLGCPRNTVNRYVREYDALSGSLAECENDVRIPIGSP